MTSDEKSSEKEAGHYEEIADIDESALSLNQISYLAKNPLLMQSVINQRGDTFYCEIFLSLVNQSFESEQAKSLWNECLQHYRNLNESLSRDVGINLAVLDYLQNFAHVISSAKIIEEEKLQFLAKTSTKDDLTDLYTRDLFDVMIEKELQEALRNQRNLSLLILDIDDFKKINDSYGHQYGDEVLNRIGAVINDSIRKMDFAARYGGEELVIIFPSTDITESKAIAERIRENVALLSKQDVVISISGGLAQLSEDINSSSSLISNADSALYRAKSSGKNKICLS